MKSFIEIGDTMILPALKAGKETTVLPAVLLRSAEERIVPPGLTLPFYSGPHCPGIWRSLGKHAAVLRDLMACGIVVIDAGRDLPGLVEEQGGQQ